MEKEYDFENPINSNVEKWCQSIYNNADYWYTENLNAFPAFIQNEYLRLRGLLKFNQPFGFLMELKDVLELLIKTPVVLNLAKFVNGMGGLQANSDFYNVLNVVFDKLELGKWFDISNKIMEFYTNKYPEQEFVEKNIIKLSIDHFKDKRRHSVDATNWRNRNIGHGALNLNFDENYRQESCVILRTIKYYMVKAANLYSLIEFYYEDDNKCIKLSEVNASRKEELHGKIYVKQNQEKYALSPFLEFIDGRIYFYDAYILDRNGQDKKNKTTMLEYADADKFSEAVKRLNNLYQQTNSHCKLPKRIISDGDAYLEDEENAYLSDNNSIFLRPAHLVNLLTKELEQYNSGVFLLQMMSGMGKSTFTKMLDHNSGFSSKNHISLNEFSIRAYYIDSDYSASIEAVRNELPQKLRRTDNNKGIKGLRSYFETKEEFAGLLNKVHSEYLKFADYANVKSKLLLIIDGLDELSGKPDAEEVFNIIPEPELLEDGVFLLLTCRTNEELSDFICSKIQDLKITKRIKISSADPDNISFVNEYLQKTLSIEDPNILNLIKQVSEGRILRASLLRFMPEYIDQYVFLTDDDLCKVFLNKLNLIYTDKFFKEVKNILLLLAMSEFPIRKDYFDQLLNYNSKDFLVKGILRDISPLISKLNLDDGTYYTISHTDFRKHIIDSYGEEQVLLLRRFMREFSETLEDGENLNYKEWFIVYYVLKYLHMVLPDAYHCLADTKTLFKLLKLITKNIEVLKSVQVYENFMAIDIANSILDVLDSADSISCDEDEEYPDDFEAFAIFASWYVIAKALSNLNNTHLAIRILKDIKVGFADDIKKWRNQYIGHGALCDNDLTLFFLRSFETLNALNCEENEGLEKEFIDVDKESTNELFNDNDIYDILGLNIPLSHHELLDSPREYVLGVLDGINCYLEETDYNDVDFSMLVRLFNSLKFLLKNGYHNDAGRDQLINMQKAGIETLTTPFEIIQRSSFDLMCNVISESYSYKIIAKNKLYYESLERGEDFTKEFSNIERNFLIRVLNNFSGSINLFSKEGYKIEIDLTERNFHIKKEIYSKIREMRMIMQALYFIIKQELIRVNDKSPWMYCVYYAPNKDYLGVKIDLNEDDETNLAEVTTFGQPCMQTGYKQEVFDKNLQTLYQCRALERGTLNAIKIIVENTSCYYDYDGETLDDINLTLEKVELFPRKSVTVDAIKEIFRCIDDEFRIIYIFLGNQETRDFTKIFKVVSNCRSISEIHKKVLQEYVTLREGVKKDFNIDVMKKELKNICFDKKFLYLTNELKREVLIRNAIYQIGKDTTQRNCVMDLKRVDWHTLTYAIIAEILK